MRNFTVQALAWAVAWGWLVAGGARADVVFSNFGPGNSYQTRSGHVVGGDFRIAVAYPFTPTGNSFTLDRIEVAIALAEGPNELDLLLAADFAGRPGVPGVVIEAFHFSNAMGPFGQNNPPLAADSVLRPLLVEGTRYWIVASVGPPTFAAWNFNSTGDVGPYARFQAGEWLPVNGTRGAYRVSGTVVIPEPATLPLLGVGCLGLLVYSWRRRVWRNKATGPCRGRGGAP